MGSISKSVRNSSRQSNHTVTNSPGKFIRSSLRHILSAALLLFWGTLFSLNAATLPAGFTETMVASGLTNPTAMSFAPDGRLFVCQQNGQLRVIKNGVLLSTPFVTVNVDPSGERGLLGVAFDPNFSNNRFVYVYYTTGAIPMHNRVSRFTANGDVAVAGSETVILELDNLSSATNHNGGAIHFGPDGKLYIAVGENANPSNAQTLTNLLGKVLRINSDGTIPTDNPFFNSATGKNRAIWALGLRNPFTFAFQPGTGRLFINDVGQDTWEEINDGIVGSNYGWPITEGPTTDPRFRGPIFSYRHTGAAITGCAIAGGAFYNPSFVQFPAAYVGNYFFADLCSGWIKLLNTTNNTASDFASGINQPVDLKVGPDGSLYYLARGSSAVFKIQYPAGVVKANTTTTVASSSNPSVFGQSVTFTATVTSASGTPTGAVQFKDGANNLGSPVALNASGVATFTTSSLTVGTHTITAEYGGDSNFNASTGTLSGGQMVNNQPKLVELSNSSYSINEGAVNTPQGFASLSINVTRTGDTSAAATVQYMTSDQSGGNECSQVTGLASQRCDYTFVGGTLRFAAGEATKTIDIPIINDGYVENNEFFTIQLSNPVGASLGAVTQATITIIDNDQTPTTGANNPYLNNAFFVRQLYLDFLDREPDQQGFNDWLNVLNTCGPEKGFLGAPPSCDRAHVTHGFFTSPESTNTAFLIYRLYEVGIGRLPLYLEFVPDMALLKTFNVPVAEQQQNLDLYLQEFTNKSGFINRFGDSLQSSEAAQLITKLEQAAGVTLPATATTQPGQPTQYGRQELINLRASGTLSVGQTVKAFVEQKVVYDKYFTRGEVTLLYFSLLRRDPSLNDPNLLGWSDWVDVFTNGRASAGIPPRDIHHLIFGFIYSEEYRKRFAAP
ncbi:MAG: PQQ-dependent sugar dehydrogenase [Pyrinomonadaceae bacterium]|nr:PQQ-dependent sugar dehydrogenase [Pyrinomonadaceae bacterium]